MSVDVKMSHNEKEDSSEIRFVMTGEDRKLDGVTFGMVFGAGQPPDIRAEFLTQHLKGLVEKEKEAKAAAKAEAAAKAKAAAEEKAKAAAEEKAKTEASGPDDAPPAEKEEKASE